jgi:hypothetical protein
MSRYCAPLERAQVFPFLDTILCLKITFDNTVLLCRIWGQKPDLMLDFLLQLPVLFCLVRPCNQPTGRPASSHCYTQCDTYILIPCLKHGAAPKDILLTFVSCFQNMWKVPELKWELRFLCSPFLDTILCLKKTFDDSVLLCVHFKCTVYLSMCR